MAVPKSDILDAIAKQNLDLIIKIIEKEGKEARDFVSSKADSKMMGKIDKKIKEAKEAKSAKKAEAAFGTFIDSTQTSMDLTQEEQKDLNEAYFRAAIAGDLTEVKKLLAAGANINSGMSGFKSPLEYIAEKGITIDDAMVSTVIFLAAQGTDVDATILDSHDTIFTVLKENPKLESKLGIIMEIRDNEELKPGSPIPQKILQEILLEAIEYEELDYVEACIAAGVDVNKEIGVVLKAAELGNELIMSALLKAGLDVNMKTVEYEETPLHYAVNNGERKMAYYLLKAGAKTDIKDKDGKTPLDYAKDEFGELTEYGEWLEKAIQHIEGKSAADKAFDTFMESVDGKESFADRVGGKKGVSPEEIAKGREESTESRIR